MPHTKPFLHAYTDCSDIEKSVEYISQELKCSDSEMTVLFVSDNCDFDKLSPLIKDKCGNNVIACSTAGEISPQGFSKNSIVGLSMHGSDFKCDTITIKDIKNINGDELLYFTEEFEQIKKKHRKALPNGNTFCLLLIDGLSGREEVVTGLLSSALVNIPIVGGSAGDGLKFVKTHIYSDGSFQENIATLTLVTTNYPFEIFKHQHFVKTEKRIVITEADPERRIVHEIDGMPAAEAYAKQLGMKVDEFTDMTFSKHPLMLKIGDEYYIRSIQKVNADKSLTFYCAIDTGLVLTLANGTDIVENFRNLYQGLENKLGEVKGCVLFECILRQLEVNDLNQDKQKEYDDILKLKNSIGFHTYGEQLSGLHINQTITGVAFGSKK